jgi:two-component system OmpR family sensor kinase
VGSRWRVLAVALLPVPAGAVAAVLLARFVPGTGLYLRSSFALVAAEAGLLAGLALAALALARRRLARDRAAVAERAADEVREEHRRFLRRLDHELKNPLTAIRAGLANLADAWPATQPPPALAVVEAQTVRLSRLVTDLRKLAEVAEGEIERVPVDVGQLLRAAAAAAEDVPGGDERVVSVSIPQVPWPLPPVLGDADLLELALWNLVSNAVKYSGPGATVELRGFEENGQVTLEVADTGTGIPDGEADQVWDELVRGSAARGVPGSGLGLSLVRAVVARHGGGCELRSRPGEGTVIRLRLPACPSRRTETATSVGRP